MPILYEGRTATVSSRTLGLDELFVDMFRDYTAKELAVIKARYATEGDVWRRRCSSSKRRATCSATIST